jgi:hypothetical protein
MTNIYVENFSFEAPIPIRNEEIDDPNTKEVESVNPFEDTLALLEGARNTAGNPALAGKIQGFIDTLHREGTVDLANDTLVAALSNPNPVRGEPRDNNFGVSFLSQYSDLVIEEVPGWQIYDPDRVLDGKNQITPGTEELPEPFFDFSDLGPQNSTGDNFNKKGEVPDGELSLYVFSTEPVGQKKGAFGVQQFVGALVEVNTSYTLTVALGNPTSDPVFPLAAFPGYTIELVADDNLNDNKKPIVLARLDGTDEGAPIPAEGEFIDVEVSFLAESGSPAIGKQLGIRLSNPASQVGVEVHFDDVRLEAEAGGSNNLFGGEENEPLIGGSIASISNNFGNDVFSSQGGNNLAIGEELPVVANIIPNFGGKDTPYGTEAGLDPGAQLATIQGPVQLNQLPPAFEFIG